MLLSLYAFKDSCSFENIMIQYLMKGIVRDVHDRVLGLDRHSSVRNTVELRPNIQWPEYWLFNTINANAFVAVDTLTLTKTTLAPRAYLTCTCLASGQCQTSESKESEPFNGIPIPWTAAVAGANDFGKVPLQLLMTALQTSLQTLRLGPQNQS